MSKEPDRIVEPNAATDFRRVILNIGDMIEIKFVRQVKTIYGEYVRYAVEHEGI